MRFLYLFFLPFSLAIFRCPQDSADEYYRHPEDCAQYVRCYNGGQQKVFTCGPGTVFSEKSATCVWPSQVPECASGAAPILSAHPNADELLSQQWNHENYAPNPNNGDFFVIPHPSSSINPYPSTKVINPRTKAIFDDGSYRPHEYNKGSVNEQSSRHIPSNYRGTNVRPTRTQYYQSQPTNAHSTKTAYNPSSSYITPSKTKYYDDRPTQGSYNSPSYYSRKADSNPSYRNYQRPNNRPEGKQYLSPYENKNRKNNTHHDIPDNRWDSMWNNNQRIMDNESSWNTKWGSRYNKYYEKNYTTPRKYGNMRWKSYKPPQSINKNDNKPKGVEVSSYFWMEVPQSGSNRYAYPQLTGNSPKNSRINYTSNVDRYPKHPKDSINRWDREPNWNNQEIQQPQESRVEPSYPMPGYKYNSNRIEQKLQMQQSKTSPSRKGRSRYYIITDWSDYSLPETKDPYKWPMLPDTYRQRLYPTKSKKINHNPNRDSQKILSTSDFYDTDHIYSRLPSQKQHSIVYGPDYYNQLLEKTLPKLASNDYWSYPLMSWYHQKIPTKIKRKHDKPNPTIIQQKDDSLPDTLPDWSSINWERMKQNPIYQKMVPSWNIPPIRPPYDSIKQEQEPSNVNQELEPTSRQPSARNSNPSWDHRWDSRYPVRNYYASSSQTVYDKRPYEPALDPYFDDMDISASNIKENKTPENGTEQEVIQRLLCNDTDAIDCEGCDYLNWLVFPNVTFRKEISEALTSRSETVAQDCFRRCRITNCVTYSYNTKIASCYLFSNKVAIDDIVISHDYVTVMQEPTSAIIKDEWILTTKTSPVGVRTIMVEADNVAACLQLCIKFGEKCRAVDYDVKEKYCLVFNGKNAKTLALNIGHVTIQHRSVLFQDNHWRFSKFGKRRLEGVFPKNTYTVNEKQECYEKCLQTKECVFLSIVDGLDGNSPKECHIYDQMSTFTEDPSFESYILSVPSNAAQFLELPNLFFTGSPIGRYTNFSLDTCKEIGQNTRLARKITYLTERRECYIYSDSAIIGVWRNPEIQVRTYLINMPIQEEYLPFKRLPGMRIHNPRMVPNIRLDNQASVARCLELCLEQNCSVIGAEYDASYARIICTLYQESDIIGGAPKLIHSNNTELFFRTMFSDIFPDSEDNSTESNTLCANKFEFNEDSNKIDDEEKVTTENPSVFLYNRERENRPRRWYDQPTNERMNLFSNRDDDMLASGSEIKQEKLSTKSRKRRSFYGMTLHGNRVYDRLVRGGNMDMYLASVLAGNVTTNILQITINEMNDRNPGGFLKEFIQKIRDESKPKEEDFVNEIVTTVRRTWKVYGHGS